MISVIRWAVSIVLVWGAVNVWDVGAPGETAVLLLLAIWIKPGDK